MILLANCLLSNNESLLALIVIIKNRIIYEYSQNSFLLNGLAKDQNPSEIGEEQK